MDAHITIDTENGVATLSIAGHLTTSTAPELEEALEPVFAQTHQVVLDFTQLEYLSSAGLRVLVAAQKEVMAAGGHLQIVGANDDVREVFDITGLVDIFDIA